MREQDVAEIRAQYHNFLKAWETGEKQLFDSCVKYIPFAYVSMYGHTYSRDQIKEWWKNPGPKTSTMKLFPLQDTILTKENDANQYAAVIGLITNGDEHIAFGGSFMNHYEKTEEGWVLETIRFQLQSDDGMREETLDADGIVHRTPGSGNRALLGEWLGVDERVGAFQDKIEHSGELVITPEMDAPWRAVKDPDNTMTDEEAVNDALCHVSTAYDYFAMMLAVPAFGEKMSADIGGMFGPMNRRDTLGYIKELRKALPRSFSGFETEDLKINEEKASVKVKVLAPEAYEETAEGISFLKDTYFVDLKKNEDRWKITNVVRSR